MGKKRRRMTSPKFAKKFAAKFGLKVPEEEKEEEAIPEVVITENEATIISEVPVEPEPKLSKKKPKRKKSVKKTKK